MSSSTRWTLLQALAWVLTRNRDLVYEFGRPAFDGRPHTIYGLIVKCADNCDGLDLTRDAWPSLAERIIVGSIRADGCPALTGAAPADRQALKIEACDLGLDEDRDTPERECFLSSPSEAQRNWYSVELQAQDVERAFPKTDTPSRAGGRRPTYDRALLEKRALEILEHVGAPDPLADDLPSQNALVTELQKFCLSRWRREPARATLQPIAKAAIALHMSRRGLMGKLAGS